jgi:hypothetical protein
VACSYGTTFTAPSAEAYAHPHRHSSRHLQASDSALSAAASSPFTAQSVARASYVAHPLPASPPPASPPRPTTAGAGAGAGQSKVKFDAHSTAFDAFRAPPPQALAEAAQRLAAARAAPRPYTPSTDRFEGVSTLKQYVAPSTVCVCVCVFGRQRLMMSDALGMD